MAYDEDTAARIRAVLAREEREVVEKRMFGGLAFMLGGHLAVCANNGGGILVRLPESHQGDPLLTLAVMGGRPMHGWASSDPDHELSDAEVARLVEIGAAGVRTRPPK